MNRTIRFRCPDCSRRLLAPERLEGAGVRCPDCHGSVSVPVRPTPPRIIPAAPVRQPARSLPAERDQAVTFLFSALLGMYGIDRFYLGQIVLGLLKLLTSGGCGVWYLVDVILAGGGAMRDAEGRLPCTGHDDEVPSPCTQMATFVLAIVCLDRFYLGQPGLGLVKLLTLGGFGLWWLIDLIVIGVGSMRDSDGLPLAR